MIAFAHEIALMEQIESALGQEVSAALSEQALRLYHDEIMILSLPNDPVENESMIKDLVKKGNKILMLQRVPTLMSAKRYLAMGIKGYGNAMMHPVYFHSAIETIRSGLIWLHPQVMAGLVQEAPAKGDGSFMELLSQREQEIAALLLEGKTNHEIAELIAITPRTVKAHASHIYHKLQVKDRLDFALHYKYN